MTTASEGQPPDRKGERGPGDGGVRMKGTARDASTLNQVAGDQVNIQLTPPLLPPVVVCTLPADTAAFTGRGREVHDIAAEVAAAAEVGGVVAIHAIDGMPGVGKTALAVHVGHLLAPRFPDRQLFLDLNAHTPGRRPTDPADALGTLLAADGVDARYLPTSLEGRAAMWRDRMATKQALLIFDNAAYSQQVAPLLPGTAGCLVLVTSRRYLGDLPTTVVTVPLDTLSPDEAVQMFVRLAPRAATQPTQVAELVALCGHLPLAISLLARLFTRHRSWTMGHLIGETRARLLTVRTESRTITAAFDLSYQDLPPARRCFFRRLGLHPGLDIDHYAAAALTDTPLDEAADHLDELHGNHLLTEPGFRRYRMHDLIRAYARTMADRDPIGERQQALGRLIDYYQHTAALADTHFTRHPRLAPATSVLPPTAVPELPDRDRAHEWMTADRANLLACIDHAAAHHQHTRVVGLTAAIAGHLRSHGPWMQAITLHAAAATAADHVDDRIGQAGALLQLGAVRQMTGDYPGATAVLEQASNIFSTDSHRLGQASALYHLGVVRYMTGDYPGATAVLEQASDIFCIDGQGLGQASALFHLGVVRQMTGDYPGATAMLEQALAIFHTISNQYGQATALHVLGATQYLAGDYPGATAVLERALDIFRSIGDQNGQAAVLDELGVVRRLTGDYPGAAAVLEQALDLFRTIGHRRGQAAVLDELGVLRRLTGDYPGATIALEQALDICRSIGARKGQADALNNLGIVRQLTGDYSGATALQEQALDIYRVIGDRTGEAEALNRTGTLHREFGDPRQAKIHHQSALKLARAIRSPLEEARAIEGLGRCALAAGKTDTATRSFRQALEIYQRIGAAEATQLAADLR